MMKAICSKFSRNLWKIARHCFSRSFSAKERKVSARAISKRCSRRLSANRPREEIYKWDNGIYASLSSCPNAEERRVTKPNGSPLLTRRRGEGEELIGFK